LIFFKNPTDTPCNAQKQNKWHKLYDKYIIVSTKANNLNLPINLDTVKLHIYLGLFGLWCSTPLTTIFQLYRDGQLYWLVMETGVPGETFRPVASH
jgi:hypothetical protein